MLVAPRRSRAHTRRSALVGYGRILVPVTADATTLQAVDLACRLAAEKGATIRIVCIVEVPELLPLDAHMNEEERAARALLEQARVAAGAYGVNVDTAVLRAREAGSVVVDEARVSGAELIVLGYASHVRAQGRVGRTAAYVLQHAPCRVSLVRAPLAA